MLHLKIDKSNGLKAHLEQMSRRTSEYLCGMYLKSWPAASAAKSGIDNTLNRFAQMNLVPAFATSILLTLPWRGIYGLRGCWFVHLQANDPLCSSHMTL